MEHNKSLSITKTKKITAWLVHGFTATGAYVGVLALEAITRGQYVPALWFMGMAIAIDAVDGVFARMLQVKKLIPYIDGALLDNIIDFFNYTIVPSFFLLSTSLVPEQAKHFVIVIIILSSCYQFTQIDAKTSDHFFKGFPSYWNIVVFYLFFWQMGVFTNLLILLFLALLSFVPIKYVYPSRLDYLAENKWLRLGMLCATLLWGISTAGLLMIYPASHFLLTSLSMGYMILYVGISLYRTWYPLKKIIS